VELTERYEEQIANVSNVCFEQPVTGFYTGFRRRGGTCLVIVISLHVMHAHTGGGVWGHAPQENF
jgi:hypothetical protein